MVVDPGLVRPAEVEALCADSGNARGELAGGGRDAGRREHHFGEGRMTPMGLHTAYGLSRIINARGPYTPLGVSRSGYDVGAAVAAAL
ncbi:hypothetical protein SALBM135S_00023 [Streptomyces alboniger]